MLPEGTASFQCNPNIKRSCHIVISMCGHHTLGHKLTLASKRDINCMKGRREPCPFCRTEFGIPILVFPFLKRYHRGQ